MTVHSVPGLRLAVSQTENKVLTKEVAHLTQPDPATPLTVTARQINYTPRNRTSRNPEKVILQEKQYVLFLSTTGTYLMQTG